MIDDLSYAICFIFTDLQRAGAVPPPTHIAFRVKSNRDISLGT